MGSFPSEIARELPGREFPDRRGFPQTIVEWTQLKAINGMLRIQTAALIETTPFNLDQHKLGFASDPNLWCIGNKLYDLTPFIPKHPGGESWLKNTKGMDIT